MGTAESRLGSAARLSLIALVASFALAPLPAHAAFPGANGQIAFNQGTCCITPEDAYKINPDGTGLSLIIAAANDPTWSPSGAKIAYWSGEHIWTANALIPGFVQEQRQTVVQAFRVRIDDSGANGVRGDPDDRIFITQGVFMP